MTHFRTWWSAAVCSPAPDLGWLTRPVATILAACIAVVAALMAYAGVTKTVRSTRRESRRKDRADALVDGLAALQTMARMTAQAGFATHPDDRVEHVQGTVGQKMNEAADAWTLANGRLVMYQMREVLSAADPLVNKAQAEWNAIVSDVNHEVDRDEVFRLYNTVVPSFRTAMKSLK
jgi:hypothetical protein